MTIEVIEHAGTKYAEIIRADMRVDKTQFFSPAESLVPIRPVGA